MVSKIARMFLSLLNNYNLLECKEDVLISLYHALIHQEIWHSSEELFIPDWLTQRMIREALKENVYSSILDPACCSGKFLYFAIKEKRSRLPENNDTLQHILNSIYGMDNNPLAVIIAKAHYIFALKGIIKKRTGRISVPIYLTDALSPLESKIENTHWIKNLGYKANLNGKSLYFPGELLKDPALYDYIIEAAKEYAKYYPDHEDRNKQQFQIFLKVQYPFLSENEKIVTAAFLFSERIRELALEQENTYGAFILKNIYKPYLLREKFDVIVGIQCRSLFNDFEPNFQKLLIEKIEKEFAISNERNDLINHSGLIYFILIVLFYLKKGGKVVLVLPKSILTAGMLNNLQRAILKNVTLIIQKTWDIEKMSPLFNIPIFILMVKKRQRAKRHY